MMNYQLIAGQYTANTLSLSSFFPAVPLKYAIVQTVADGIRIGRVNKLRLDEANHDFLRLHFFGEQGDLTWRFDEGICYWRYVGNDGVEFAEAAGGKVYAGELSLSSSVTSLLWGQLDGKHRRWYDDRVGKASVSDRLIYPVAKDAAKDGCRVELLAYNVFNNEGELMAIWAYDMKPQQEEPA